MKKKTKNRHEIKHPKGICFFSKDLNKEKYEAIKAFAKKVIECKNHMSVMYYNFYHFKHKVSKYDFWKEMKEDKVDVAFDIPSEIFQQACFDVHSKYFKKKPPKGIVTFKKLSFIGVNTTPMPMFVMSDNIHTNGIINFNIPKQELIAVPFKHSKKYHGDLSKIHYSRKGMNGRQYQKLYRLTINEGSETIKIATTEEDEEYKEWVCTKNKILGVDVNVSRNLFMCSDGHYIEHDKKLIKKLIFHDTNNARITETKKKRGLSLEYGKKQKKIDEKDIHRAKMHIVMKLLELFRYAKSRGYDHIVLEDLAPFYGKKYIKSKYEGANHNRLMHVLHLFDIKNVAIALGKKHGIAISLVPAAYTSKTCPVCGHIHKDNRKTQAFFKCLSCGYEADADQNAAINIKRRVSSEVLRRQLTEEKELNRFEAKDLSLEEIRKIIA